MPAVVLQARTESFRVEGNIPLSVIDYLKENTGPENLDYEDEHADADGLDRFNAFRASETPVR